MAEQTETQKRLPSQENLLLDYVHRLEKHKTGRKIVLIHLSKLKPYNRRKQHLRAAAHSFEGLVKSLKGQLFQIKNADLFFIYKSEAQAQVETTVRKVRFLFGDDPLIENERKDGPSFSTWYDAERDFEQVLRLVQDLADVERKKKAVAKKKMDSRAALLAKQQKGEPLTPEILQRVEQALERADLSNLVRRQFICSIDEQMVPEQIFSELFISIMDLRETLLPGVNLTSNQWLFQHLTEALDKRMLAMLIKTDTISLSGDISFNLNLSTLLSPEFQAFDESVTAGRRGAMIIELQKLDILANLGSYLFAREYIQDKGYRVCLDGLTHDTFKIIKQERLGADLIKLVWHSEMMDGGERMHGEIQEIVEKTGPAKVVLCRVDNREAVDFGHSVGINQFQGRFVENLIAEDNRRRELLKIKRRMERNEEEKEEE